MITSITIENFKSIPSLSIDKLGRINLIAGKNNAGKSTFLEAIELLYMNTIQGIRKNLLRRGLQPYERAPDDASALEKISTLWHCYNSSSKIYIASTNNKQQAHSKSLTITDKKRKYADDIDEINIIVRKNNTSNNYPTLFEDEFEDEDYKALEIETNNEISVIPLVRVFRSSFINHFRPQQTENVCYLSQNNNIDVAQLWDQIVMTSLENHVIDALSIIEPNIENIVFIDTPNSKYRVPLIKLKEDNERHYLSSMGDGLQRILKLILSIITTKDGIILIDELENGLHYSIMPKLWELLYKISIEFNQQLFITTHSGDILHSFADYFVSKNEDIGRLLRIEKESDTHQVTTCTVAQILLGKQFDINLR